MMIRLLRCWGIDLFVGLIGLGITAHLTPQVAPGRHIPELDQTLRILLPWTIITLVMTVIAGALYRERSEPSRRLIAILLVPLLMTLIVAITGFPGEGGFVWRVVYLLAGLLGTVLGLSLANQMSEEKPFPGYWRASDG